MRWIVRGVLLVVALVTGLTASAQAPDAARVLADMRQALGGDAIDAVQAFSVEATEDRFSGRINMATKVEWVCVLPDRFIQTRRYPNQSADFAITFGFHGDELVQQFPESLAGRRLPAETAPATPEEQAANRRASFTYAKQKFSRLVIAMLGITSVYPLDARYVVQERLDGKPVDVLELTADGYWSRLYVDTATHLPRMITWTASPEPDELMNMRRPSRLPLVERRIYFSDYKKAEGLNWPHRLTEVVGRAVVLETRLGKFKINTQIDPKRVDPPR